ncbi:hypothetical protein [Longibacter sp.]|jgi:hypothetical protein|uniref:hypothetical protein n=1 Tax=Longibacter sp. TaxID=2045415 RepID=UPI003EC0E81B
MDTDSTTYRQRQLLLFAVGILLLTDPFLSIFRRNAFLGEIPVLVVALFSVWALLIAGTAWLMERPATRPSDPRPSDPPPSYRDDPTT